MKETGYKSDAAEANLALRLREFRPLQGTNRFGRQEPLRVLHLLSQQPGRTGSGVALMAMVRYGAQAGYVQRAVIGLPGEAPLPEIPPLSPAAIFPVRFDRPPVPFAIAGMSDVMPYVSTRFSTFTSEMRDGYLAAFAAALAAATEGFAPDIIQSNHLWLLTALARVLFPRTPLCAYSHGTELRQLKSAAQLAPFVRPACAAVDRVLALHAENKAQIMQAYGIPAERIRIVGAGFRDDLFRPPAACPAPAAQETLTIVYAGKISAAKGVPWLIAAMRRVEAPAGKKVRLLLAGASGDAGGETIRAEAADLPQVVFLGALAQPELATVLQAADVFVLPSFYEGLPLVVIEALACGCRVVMTDLPGLDDWMPAGLCGQGVVARVALPRLIGADTPVAEDLPRFETALAEALNRQLACAVAAGRVAAGEGRLAPLSWSGVFDRMRAVYRELL